MLAAVMVAAVAVAVDVAVGDGGCTTDGRVELGR